MFICMKGRCIQMRQRIVAKRNNLPLYCATLMLKQLPYLRLFVAAAATVYQEPHFWRTEGQELFAFLFDQKNFHV